MPVKQSQLQLNKWPRKTQELTPNTLESMAEPKDQRGSGSTSTVATAEQAVIDGGVPATTKDKRSNQAVTEHHDNPVKLEPGFARAEAHRRATATVKRTQR